MFRYGRNAACSSGNVGRSDAYAAFSMVETKASLDGEDLGGDSAKSFLTVIRKQYRKQRPIRWAARSEFLLTRRWEHLARSVIYAGHGDVAAHGSLCLSA